MQQGVECESDDNTLGEFETVQGCADRCKNTTGCDFFIYGQAGTGKAHRCYQESTLTAECKEGFQARPAEASCTPPSRLAAECSAHS